MEDGRTISASQFLEHFMFPPKDQYKRIAKLSGGELRRLHLLTVLIRNPNFLILDEPTNDLDLFALNRLEEFLMGFSGCLVIVSHDRYFLDKLTDHLFVFHGEGRIEDYYGSYTSLRLRQEHEAKSRETGSIKTAVKGSPSADGKDSAKEKTRLSYKEQREYEQLEPEIEKLETEKAQLEDALSSGTLDHQALEEHSRRVAEIMELVEEKMLRWMELGQYVK
jgi:ATP-binding cassette subfamily F protein uup